MRSNDFIQLMYRFIMLSVLLIGTALRAVVPFFQKVFLPASVIGGIIGLILGPTVRGKIRRCIVQHFGIFWIYD